jgi:hypothetical protein
MPGANGGKHLLGGNGAVWVSLLGVIDADNLLAHPLPNGSVTLL